MKNRRGSIVVMYMLILSTLITGAVASVAVLSNSQTQGGSVGYDRDQAFYAAEAGVQRAIWNLKYNASASTWLAALPITETWPNGNAKYKITTSNVNWPTNPVNFQCIGTSQDGTVTSQASVTIADSSSTNSGFCPGFSMSGSDGFAGTLNIAGTFETTGNFSAAGKVTLITVSGQPAASLEIEGTCTCSSVLKVPGNLYSSGKITVSGSATVGGNVQSGGQITHSGTLNVTGTTTQNSDPLPGTSKFTTPAVDTSGLIAGNYGTVQTISGGAPSSLNLDFSQNPVIEINGNLTISGANISITPPASGTGTLIINGALNLSGTLGTSASPAALNIVTTGNITQSGTQYVTGALCCGGVLTCSGTYNVNGCTVVQKGIAGSGTMNLNYVSPPSYVNYAAAGAGVGATTTNVVTASNFMGPMY
ncbi:MAG TPA: hypothetical protein VGG19_01105 [Tepidisphaeraceae bacterium]|jgi:cytoskeletal protein CcmA (bactofilin family)